MLPRLYFPAEGLLIPTLLFRSLFECLRPFGITVDIDCRATRRVLVCMIDCLRAVDFPLPPSLLGIGLSDVFGFKVLSVFLRDILNDFPDELLFFCCCCDYSPYAKKALLVEVLNAKAAASTKEPLNAGTKAMRFELSAGATYRHRSLNFSPTH